MCPVPQATLLFGDSQSISLKPHSVAAVSQVMAREDDDEDDRYLYVYDAGGAAPAAEKPSSE